MSKIVDPPRGGGGSRPTFCAQTGFWGAFTAQIGILRTSWILGCIYGAAPSAPEARISEIPR